MASESIIIIDKKMPDGAKQALREYGELFEFESAGITYPAISGHPDIFFCQTPAGLVVAPELPDKYFEALKQKKLNFVKGGLMPGSKYPQTASYNAVVSGDLLIHNLKVTDSVILNVCNDLQHIHVKQAYTRCNLLALNNIFMTSDKGIENTLTSKGINCTFLPPEGIKLEGFSHGFLGGACGVYEDRLFVCGSLNYYSKGKEFKQIADQAGYYVVELYDGPLVDVGSLLMC
jgi:hypothetical protein